MASTIYKVFDNGSGTQIALGAGGLLIVSTDGGATWNLRSSGTTEDLYDAAYTNAWGVPAFVVVGANGTILTSSDTVTWFSRTSFASGDLYGVAYSGVFMAVGEAGALGLSEDGGVTWTAKASGTTEDLVDITADLGAYLIVGTGDTIITGLIATLLADVDLFEGLQISESVETQKELDATATASMEMSDDVWYIHDALGAGTTLTQSGSNQQVYITETMVLAEASTPPTGNYGQVVTESFTLLSAFVDQFFRNVSGDLAWPMFTVEGSVLSGSTINGEIIWPLFRTSGRISKGTAGEIVWPLFEVEGVISPDGQPQGEIPWPMFQVEGYITENPLIITQTDLEVWVLNLESGHHSQYQDFQPNSFGIFNGSPVVATPDGLYVLGGTDDDGVEIDGKIYWPPSDLADVVMKGLESVFIRLRGAIENINLIVIIDEDEKRVFRVNLERTKEGNMVKRIPMPKGFNGQVYQFGIEYSGATGMHLFEMEVQSVPFTRRLR